MHDPYLNPLKGEDAAPHIAARLADAQDVRFAFIFGSVAKGAERSDSDLDLMVVGAIQGRELARRLRDLGDMHVGRLMNWINYTEEEWRARVEARNHFVLTVLEAPKIFVRGTADDVAAVVSGAGSQTVPTRDQ
jgi:hypothetical protein